MFHITKATTEKMVSWSRHLPWTAAVSLLSLGDETGQDTSWATDVLTRRPLQPSLECGFKVHVYFHGHIDLLEYRASSTVQTSQTQNVTLFTRKVCTCVPSTVYIYVSCYHKCKCKVANGNSQCNQLCMRGFEVEMLNRLTYKLFGQTSQHALTFMKYVPQHCKPKTLVFITTSLLHASFVSHVKRTVACDRPMPSFQASIVTKTP